MNRKIKVWDYFIKVKISLFFLLSPSPFFFWIIFLLDCGLWGPGSVLLRWVLCSTPAISPAHLSCLYFPCAPWGSSVQCPASMLDKSHFLSLLGQFIFSKLSSIGILRAKILFTPLIYSNCFTGTIVRRHQIPLPPPHEDQFYTIHHFNINTEVTFYGRKYKIVDCDLYTKNFLRKIGIRVNPPASLPDDPYTTERQKVRGGSSSENLIWIKLDLNAY